ncbi:MAG: tetratricopeptide repeat protein [Phycisphaeraceae bacterium]|nr:tetratricopeptide repeat protein [Phycisphaeraceae bacterium]
MISPEPLYQKAVQAANQGNYELAQMFLRELLSAHPHVAKAHHLTATTHMRMGALEKALPHARMAVKLNPTNAASRWVLGICLSNSGDIDAAIPEFRAGCELAPADPQGWNNLGQALLEKRQYSHAETALRRGLALSQNVPQLSMGLAWVLWNVGRAEEALDVIRGQRERTPNDVPLLAVRAMMSLYSTNTSNEDLRVSHVELGRSIEAMTPLNPNRVPDPTPSDAERPLRVGFLSPDLYGHSVSRFLEPILRHGDYARLIPALYSCYQVRDEVSGRLESMCGLWCDVYKLGDQMAAAEIRRHNLDILIDLAGHTPLNRSILLCHRPAPITMTYLGYPHSTGYTRIDYRIVDSITDPPGESDANATEKLLRLDPCFLCFTPVIDPPEVGAVPEDAAQPIRFGTFNNAAKYSPMVLEMWSEILKAEPTSKLVLKSYQFSDAAGRDYVLGSLEKLGIDPARIELLEKISLTREHLLAYHNLHIALDTFPYHGTTTTCEALLMGTPVITLEGNSHRSRVGVSLLSAVGVPELIARTRDEYVEKAVALARDRQRLVRYRTTLREQMQKSVLMDGAGFYDRFEKLLRTVWREKCGVSQGGATSPT